MPASNASEGVPSERGSLDKLVTICTSAFTRGYDEGCVDGIEAVAVAIEAIPELRPVAAVIRAIGERIADEKGVARAEAAHV